MHIHVDQIKINLIGVRGRRMRGAGMGGGSSIYLLRLPGSIYGVQL